MKPPVKPVGFTVAIGPGDSSSSCLALGHDHRASLSKLFMCNGYKSRASLSAIVWCR